MKSRIMTYFKYFSLFFILIALILINGCYDTPTSIPIDCFGTPTPTPTPTSVPIINYFLADPSSIMGIGGSSTLSWSVTGATSVTIDNGIGSVALTGTTVVSPTKDTTYTLTATNSAGSVTESVKIYVYVMF